MPDIIGHRIPLKILGLHVGYGTVTKVDQQGIEVSMVLDVELLRHLHWWFTAVVAATASIWTTITFIMFRRLEGRDDPGEDRSSDR